MVQSGGEIENKDMIIHYDHALFHNLFTIFTKFSQAFSSFSIVISRFAVRSLFFLFPFTSQIYPHWFLMRVDATYLGL